MAVFALVATLLTLATLGVVLWPLLRESRGLAVGCVLAVGLAVFALYRVVGTPAGIGVAASPAAQPPISLEAAVAQLRAELESNPRQPQGWQLLGKSLAEMGNFPGARDAFAKALALSPDDPDFLVEAAQARLYAAEDRKLDAEAVSQLQRALSLQPDHQRGRWLLGMAQRQEGQAAEAAATWEPLLSKVDSATAASLRVQINAARRDAGLPEIAEPAATAAGHSLAVRVSLDPAFAARARLRGDASVFVIARRPGGPPMPIAVQKHALADLPLAVTLSDQDSPMPTQRLSELQEVEVFARISDSGNAIRQEGDLDSAAVLVKLPASGPVELILGQPQD